MIKVSALSLLAYKVGPNLFDLSSQMYHVSMRDQMHRAVALAEALVAGDQFKVCNQVLSVGAGVAGVSAGIVLARHGVDVQIIDTSDKAPFALQRGVFNRYVGPYMYEWPLDVYGSQKMPQPRFSALAAWDNGRTPPLPFGFADPAEPPDLVVGWDNALRGNLKNPSAHLRLQIGVKRDPTNGAIKAWLVEQRRAFEARKEYESVDVDITGGAPWQNSQPLHQPLRPRFVILAGGLGTENTQIKGARTGYVIQGLPFWASDRVLEHQCGFTFKPRIVVLGGGDGALQDTLRALTRHIHPVDTWHQLLSRDVHGTLADGLPRIISLEAQHAQMSIWAHNDALRASAQETLDQAYAVVAQELSQDSALAFAAMDMLRDDVESVRLCIKESYFSKSYSLNRFMVHYFEQCIKRHGGSGVAGRFEISRNCELMDIPKLGPPTTLRFSAGNDRVVDLVVVRFGVDTSQLPGQTLGLSKQDTQNRQELAAVPLPLYFPPSK